MADLHVAALVLLAVLLLEGVLEVSASVGDHSFVFVKCLKSCVTRECLISDEDFAKRRPFYMNLLRWTCLNECDYRCMWKTVQAFEKDGTNIPQFHGKWPFIRVLGIQEPASVIFSLANLLPHLYILKFRKEVPSTAPMYYVWHMYALVGANAWFWSIVFHTRDFPFTEKMDYFGAISLVLFNLYCVIVRFVGTDKLWKPFLCAIPLLAFFTYHVHYLGFVKFDYGYNMKANVAVGVLNSLAWLTWCYWKRKKLKYVKKCAFSILAVNVLLLLELFDFPPIWWTFDAHSLWHAGTAPLSFVWYSFIIEDCQYLQAQEELKGIDLDKKKD